MSSKPQRKILIVDDHPMVRERLVELINKQAGWEVCAEAATAAQALEVLAVTAVDLAIVDLSLRGHFGLELIKDIHGRHPEVRVLVLSMHDESLYAERAFRAGARGYITKHEASARVLEAVRRVLDGELYMSEKLAAMFARKFVTGGFDTTSSPVALLSDRELAVFEAIGGGETTRQIAGQLHVSVKTVESYLARVKDKLRVGTAAELLRYAIAWRERGAGI